MYIRQHNISRPCENAETFTADDAGIPRPWKPIRYWYTIVSLDKMRDSSDNHVLSADTVVSLDKMRASNDNVGACALQARLWNS